MIQITVVPAKNPKGYSLKHNQHKGWSGTIREDNVWAWYKHKYDAQARADELNKYYNK